MLAAHRMDILRTSVGQKMVALSSKQKFFKLSVREQKFRFYMQI